MKLSAPTMAMFIISVILAALGFFGFLNVLPAVAAYHFWLMTAGFVVLALGVMFKGM